MKAKHPYLHSNSHIYQEFERIALMRIAKGERVSAKAIFEMIRNDSPVRESGELKVNNNYTPLLAREFISKYPEYANHFAKRNSKYDCFYTAAPAPPTLF